MDFKTNLKFLVAFVISTAFAVAAISHKSITVTENFGHALEVEVSEAGQTEKFTFDLDSMLEPEMPGLETLVSNAYISNLVLHQNIIVNSSVNSIYLAHAPPFLS